jgi:hypothetical protein
MLVSFPGKDTYPSFLKKVNKMMGFDFFVVPLYPLLSQHNKLALKEEDNETEKTYHICSRFTYIFFEPGLFHPEKQGS